jgi:hypothetical protein
MFQNGTLRKGMLYNFTIKNGMIQNGTFQIGTALQNGIWFNIVRY